MKRALGNLLKLGIPLGIGCWLVYKQYHDLNPEQRDELFEALRAANLPLLGVATLVGWLAHVSRAWRWRYLLEPLGMRPRFWACYHAVMIGYFMNLFLPRAGEASRAAALYRSEDVPFNKGFGTIMAERVVDMVALLTALVLAALLQLDKLDLFRAQIERFKGEQGSGADQGASWTWLLAGVLVAGLAGGAILLRARPALRARALEALRGFMEGLRAVLRTNKKGLFAAHTLLIWAGYLGMFQIGFYCLPGMSEVPFAGILAGFIAGGIGIILVQGGIGVYPAFVALIVGVYMPPPAGGGLLRPDALAMGWLLWAAQTAMIVALGGLSLLLTALQNPARK